MEFEKRKASVLAAIAMPEPDKSPKGTLDAPIVPLLATINRHPSFFTTSSCSGRISILSHPISLDCAEDKEETDGEEKGRKKKKKAGGGSWLLVTHDLADPQSVVDLLFGDGGARGAPAGGALVFRFEPFILAVECRDAGSAQSLVATAIACGFRESGITSLHKRIMVAIRCSIRLEVPLGEIGRMMVPPDYVIYLVKIANEKMKANRKRTDCFLQALRHEGAFCLTVADNKKKRVHVNKNDKGDLSVPRVKQIKQLDNDAESFSGLHQSKVKIMDDYLRNSVKNSNLSCELDDQMMDETETGFHSGSPRAPEFALFVKPMMIVGEPIEKLFIWGHSACTFNENNHSQILVFGGFGGLGRHARRNNTLLLDPQSGLLREIIVQGPPPRLGHTSSVVGRHVFIIGGRGDPTQIFNDVWDLDTVENRWMLLECSGSVFHQRHRHAAAVIGSNIYVFGGLSSEVIYSCMHVLDSESMQWSEVEIQGEWPCARHSHALVAEGSQLFMFGGHDGQKALGDLYTFDVETFSWKIMKTTGRAPFPRFSHSMFVYENYLGIIGGCPVRQHHQEVALLHLVHHVWRYVVVDSVDKDLWVRSSTNVVDNDLVIVGGGASCYAFGTKFSQPMKIGLCSLVAHSESYDESVVKCSGSANNHCNSFAHSFNSISLTNERKSHCSDHSETTSNSYNLKHIISGLAPGDIKSEYAVLQLEKRYAKLGKDVLKKFGWLDLKRKVEPSQDGLHILLPISFAFFEEMVNIAESLDSSDGCSLLESFTGRGFSMNEIGLPRALNILLACGASILNDDKACSRKIDKCPQKVLRDAVYSLMQSKGVLPELLDQVPTRWEHLGDIVILPVTSFKDPVWNTIGEDLWPIVAKSLGARRLARQGRILPTGTRDSTLEILVGEDGWVTHQENSITYSFDATKCMFCSGNFSEKLRMAQLDCKNEVIVDLFTGIGYFVLPFLVRAKARLVYACEWNPHALEALRHNLEINLVADRCYVLEGDNRMTAPKGVADRVCLGLLPSSEGSWLTAVRALRSEGGILHIHGNVNDSEENVWTEYVVTSINNIAKLEGHSWDVSLQHLERVKWYGPRVRHLVADIRCKAL